MYRLTPEDMFWDCEEPGRWSCGEWLGIRQPSGEWLLQHGDDPDYKVESRTLRGCMIHALDEENEVHPLHQDNSE